MSTRIKFRDKNNTPDKKAGVQRSVPQYVIIQLNYVILELIHVIIELVLAILELIHGLEKGIPFFYFFICQTLSIWLGIQFRQRYSLIKDKRQNIFF